MIRSERKNVSQPSDWWAAWEHAAAAKGMLLAEWIGHQCNQGLPRDVRDQLSDRGKRGRPTESSKKSVSGQGHHGVRWD